MTACAVCDETIDPDEWDDRHSPHDPGCESDPCSCSAEVHARCCPECAP